MLLRFLSHFDVFGQLVLNRIAAKRNLVLCIMIKKHKNVSVNGFSTGRTPHLIIVLFSKHGTFLNDLLQMMPVYPTSHIL